MNLNYNPWKIKFSSSSSLSLSLSLSLSIYIYIYIYSSNMFLKAECRNAVGQIFGHHQKTLDERTVIFCAMLAQ